MSDQIRCVDCKHFQQERDDKKWGRCQRAVDSTEPSLFYPSGEFCADTWLEVHHDFGCVMGSIVPRAEQLHSQTCNLSFQLLQNPEEDAE